MVAAADAAPWEEVVAAADAAPFGERKPKKQAIYEQLIVIPARMCLSQARELA